MQKVRIRSMLNHLKLLQASQKDIDIDSVFAQLQAQYLAPSHAGVAQKISKQILSQYKTSGFTHQTLQTTLKSDETFLEMQGGQKSRTSQTLRKKQNFNIHNFQNFRKLKTRRNSDNLEQLGIEKKTIAERSLQKGRRLSDATINVSQSTKDQERSRSQIRHRKIYSRKVIQNVCTKNAQRYEAVTTNLKTIIPQIKNKTKKNFMTKINFNLNRPNKVLKYKKLQIEDQEEICPWDNLRSSTRSYF